jgi:hypothetical protein
MLNLIQNKLSISFLLSFGGFLLKYLKIGILGDLDVKNFYFLKNKVL